MKNKKKVSHKITETITQINNSVKKQGISVARLFRLIGRRSYYVLSFLSFLIVLLPIPMPPGFVLVLAIPSVFITAQILYGVDAIYLPKFISNLHISQAVIRKIDTLSKKWLFSVEKITRQRLQFLSSPKVIKVHHIALFMFALGCIIPIPFVCMVPALGGLLLSAGLLIGDGVLILLGWFSGLTGWTLIWSTIKVFISLKNHIPNF